MKPCAAKLPAWTPKALAGFAFVCTLIGTILSGAGPNSMKTFFDNMKTIYDAQNAAYPAFAVSLSLGAGFGCSIAATIVQAIATGLTFLPAASAPELKLAVPPASTV